MASDWKTSAEVGAFVLLSLLGGRLLVSSSFGRTRQVRILAAIGAESCLAIYAAFVIFAA